MKKLHAIGPFNFPRLLVSHGWAKLAPYQKVEGSSSISYTAQLNDGQVVEIKVSDAGDGVYVEMMPQLAGYEEVVRDMINWMFSLQQDLGEFYNMARDHPKLSHVVEQGIGRLLRCPSVFEELVKTILTTNTRWTGTIRMVDALVQGYGKPWPDNVQKRAFPTPEVLARVDLEKLRKSAGLGYRTPYVNALAQDVVSGVRDLEGLKHSEHPTEEIRKELLSIKGVGEYAAASVLMLLGRFDFIPVDSWALRLVSHEWHAGAQVGQDEVEEAFQTWGSWKGLAYWFWDWEYLKETEG
jgi:3-methyladenine DNA glycosylase/8-oxoguanine DNA glycosylase